MKGPILGTMRIRLSSFCTAGLINAFLPLLFCFQASFSQAQIQQDIDSLSQRLEATAMDTNRVLLLNALAWKYTNTRPDTAKALSKQAYDLAQKLDFTRGIGAAKIGMGQAISKLGDLDGAINEFKEAKALYQQQRMEEGMARCASNLSWLYRRKGNFEQALEEGIASLHYFEQFPDKRLNAGRALGNVGMIYYFMSDVDNAITYYNRALEIFKELKERRSIISVSVNLAMVYKSKEEYDLALETLNPLIPELEADRNVIALISVYNTIGLVYLNKEEAALAKEYLDKTVQLQLQIGMKDNLSTTYINLGLVEKMRNQPTLAIDYFNKSYQLAVEAGVLNQQRVVLNELANIYEEDGNYRKALEARNRYQVVHDSIFNAESDQRISELREQYEVEKKEQEIVLLEKDNLLLQREKEAEARQKRYNLAGMLGLLVIAALGFAALRLKMNRDKAKKNLVELELDNSRLREKQMQQEIAFREKQLTTKTLQLIQKNELMTDLKEKIAQVSQKHHSDSEKEIQDLRGLINYGFHLDKDWEEFKLHFEQVNSNFFASLNEQHPGLSQNQLRLAALIRLRLNIKESATILNLSPNSVRVARVRLRKKLELSKEENLEEFMMNI